MKKSDIVKLIILQFFLFMNKSVFWNSWLYKNLILVQKPQLYNHFFFKL